MVARGAPLAVAARCLNLVLVAAAGRGGVPGVLLDQFLCGRLQLGKRRLHRAPGRELGVDAGLFLLQLGQRRTLDVHQLRNDAVDIEGAAHCRDLSSHRDLLWVIDGFRCSSYRRRNSLHKPHADRRGRGHAHRSGQPSNKLGKTGAETQTAGKPDEGLPGRGRAGGRSRLGALSISAAATARCWAGSWPATASRYRPAAGPASGSGWPFRRRSRRP